MPSSQGPALSREPAICALLAGSTSCRSTSSNLDDQLGTVDEGCWIGLLGRFVCSEDSQGFFSYEVFDSDEDAKHAFLGHEREEELEDFTQGFIPSGQ